jgi:hypothetical protein
MVHKNKKARIHQKWHPAHVFDGRLLTRVFIQVMGHEGVEHIGA